MVGQKSSLRLESWLKTDVQCMASLNRRLLLAAVLVGEDAEETKDLQC